MNEDVLQLERFLKYDLLVQLWREFCKAHTELYDLTCEEYLHLLNSEIEELEGTLKIKERVLDKISFLENKRRQLIQEINDKKLFNSEISNVSGLLETLENVGLEKKGKHLQKFNELLIDIVTKIQKQNKKNQVFLNKAMLNLRDLKEGFSGKKNYKTYTSAGMTR